MTLLRNVTFDVRNLLKLSPTHTISQSNFHLSKKTDVLTGQKFKNEDVFYQCLHNGVQIKSIMDSLPIVKSSLIKCKEAEECKEAIDWFSRVFDYIVPYGKRHRVSTIVRTFETINPDAPIHDLLRAHAVGWSLELLQAAALIADDIEDHGVHRRGKPSWHTLPDVQMIAVNDLMILQNSAFTTINNFCEGHPCHMNVLKLMSETARLTGMGQSIDLLDHPPHAKIINFDLMSMDRLERAAKYKTSVYAFCHPVQFGLYLSEMNSRKLHEDVFEFLVPFGYFYQIQDDFIDVFGKKTASGKRGMDIQDGKCSWMIIRALEKANTEQKAILKQNYGQRHEDCEKRVLEVFEQLQMREEYAVYERKTSTALKKSIDDFERKYPQVPRKIFDVYLQSLIGRER